MAVEDAPFYYLFYSRTLHLFRTLHYIISRTLFLGHFNYLIFIGHLIDEFLDTQYLMIVYELVAHTGMNSYRYLRTKLVFARSLCAIRKTAY